MATGAVHPSRDQSRICSEALNGHPPWVPLEEQTMLDKLKNTN